jgi:hypothetical protein
MKRAIVAQVLIALAATQGGRAEQSQAGRYQMVAVPASPNQTFPEVFLLDTATGQNWKLFHETGQPIQWLPVRFGSGKDRPAAALPPPPDTSDPR